MPEENLSDEYVATLLAQDAKSISAKYSASCLQTMWPKRPTTNAPKPNTRFLKNIIKETDSHNAALRAKEAQDARARLRRLHRDNMDSSFARTSRSDEEDLRAKRRRLDHGRDEDSILQQRHGKLSSKRKSNDDQEVRGPRQHHHRDDEHTEDDPEHVKHERHSHHHRGDRHRSRRRLVEEDARHSRGRSSRYKNRSRSPRADRDRRYNHKHRRARSVSLSIYPDRKVPSFAESDTLLANSRSKNQEGTKNIQHKTSTSNESESDPLESIIGPRPPPPAPKVRARGRGTFASSSAMDSHFSSQYNPSEDVHPNSDSDNDWDQVLEALRDRQRWKQQGADRLRSAGFTEEEVGKWERGGEKREEDVRWKGRGEGREWDRGKIVGDEGIETKSEWGRLKGT